MTPALTSANQQFLNALDRTQSALSQAQLQVSSGLKVAQASDAPDQVSPILQLHVNIAQNQQTQTNLNQVKGEVDTAEQSVSSVASLLDQVQTLAVQGLSTSQTADTRGTLAAQVQSILEQVVSISSTSVNGRYIFGGDTDQSPSYQVDGTAATGVARLSNSQSTRQVQDTQGLSFSVGLSANAIFDRRDANDQVTTGNVFAAIHSVQAALASNDTKALQDASASVRDASSYVNQQLAFYGGIQNRVAAALDQTTAADTGYRSQLSDRQDADVTAAILEMQQLTVDIQAAMSSKAQMPQGSLFDELSR
jgi:flagellar hook-associated protein 3 FlgL